MSRTQLVRSAMWATGFMLLGAGLCALSVWSSWVQWEGFWMRSDTDHFGYQRTPSTDIGSQILLFAASMSSQLAALGIATIIGSLFLLAGAGRTPSPEMTAAEGNPTRGR